jgi:O-antigen/teichoic acid export membrane protein
LFSRLKFTAKSTAIYSLGNIGIKFIGLILLPLYTDRLTTEEYGMWSLLEVTSQLLVMAFGLRLSAAMLRFFASEKTEEGKSKVVFTAFLASFVSVIIFNLTVQPINGWLSDLFFDSRNFASYFTLLTVWASLEIFNRLVMDLIRIREKPGLYITVTLLKFTGVLLLIIYLIAYRGMGIKGIIIGQLFGSGLLLVFTFPFIFRQIKLKADLAILKEMIRYGFPLIFSGMATFVLAMGDRFLIKIFLDYHEVGVYSLSYKFSNLVKIVFVQSFQLGFLPIAFNMFDKPDAKRFFTKVFTYYVFIVFWAGLALSLFSEEVIYLFSSNEAYYEAYRYIPFLALGICFYGMQSFFLLGIHFSKKTHVIAIITITVLIINIGLNSILIPRIGLMGAAITYILSGLVMAGANYYQSQKYYHIPYEMRKVFIIVLLSVALFSASAFVPDINLVPDLIIKLILIALFPILLILFRFYEPVEVERILGAWRKWRNPAKWRKNIKKLLSDGIDDVTQT